MPSSADDLRAKAEQLRRSLPPRPEASGPADEGTRLATIHRSADAELRVSWRTYENHPFVSLRIWTRGGSGGWWPDAKRGLSIRIRELPDIAAAIASAMDMAEAGQQHQATRPVPAMPGRLPTPPPWSTTSLPMPTAPADGDTSTSFSEFAE